MSEGKITAMHRRRRAVVYVRQSTPGQVERNVESTARQYALRERAVELGWPAEQVVVVDEDLGRLGASSEGRFGFKERQISPISARGLKCVVDDREILSEHRPPRETVHEPEILERRDVTEIPYQRTHKR